MEPWRSGKSGMYLRVLKWLSEYGLSSETWGRLWVFVTPRSAINSATGLEVIEVPRSAWMVKSPATMPCFAHVSAISRLASSAVSRGGDHPAHHIAAEDIQDDVEVEVSPLGRSQQLRYIPGPNLIGARGQQFRLRILRMPQLVAALLKLLVLSQDAMHGADRTEVHVFVQQRGKDLDWSLVAEALRVQMIEHRLPFGRTQGPRWRGTNPVRNGRQHAPIERGARHTEGAAGNRFADTVTQFQGGAHQFSSSIWMFGIGLPNNVATFFWTSMISSAFFSFLVKRAMTTCCSRFSLTNGLKTTLGPRFLGVRASITPCFRCRFQVVRCEE